MSGLEQGAVALTQGILRIPYYWNSPSVPEELDASRISVHDGLLELVYKDRSLEQDLLWEKVAARITPENAIDRATWAQEWEARWHFTSDRQQDLIRRHPLTVRLAGRAVMRLNNEERLDDYGQPLTEDIARECTLVPIGHLVSFRPEGPLDIALHLGLAGFFSKPRARTATLPGIMHKEIPDDAITYMESYPPAIPPQAGEMNRVAMRAAFDASDNMLLGIMREYGLYPVVRRFEGRGGRESEFYIPSEVTIIERAVMSMPKIGDNELPISAVIPRFGSWNLFIHVQARAGVETPYRRLPGQGRGMCIDKGDLPAMRQAYNYLTTLQSGEKGYEEIAADMGVSVSTARACTLQIDIDAARPIWPKGADFLSPRRAFPPDVVSRIKSRIGTRLALNPQIQAGIRRAATTQQRPNPVPIPVTEAVELTSPPHRPAAPQETPIVASDPGLPPEVPVDVPVAESAPAVPAAAEPERAVIEEVPVEIEEPEEAEPRSHGPVTLAQITTIMRVASGQVIKEFLTSRPAGSQAPIGNIKTLPSHSVPGAHAARIARTLLAERIRRMPSMGATVQQIALAVDRDPDDIISYLTKTQLLPSDTPVDQVYVSQGKLRHVLDHFGVQLES